MIIKDMILFSLFPGLNAFRQFFRKQSPYYFVPAASLAKHRKSTSDRGSNSVPTQIHRTYVAPYFLLAVAGLLPPEIPADV